MTTGKTRIALIPATAATGADHPLLVETLSDGRVMVTVMGANGTKRHASSILTENSINTLINALFVARARMHN
jgi:hypothetical protein